MRRGGLGDCGVVDSPKALANSQLVIVVLLLAATPCCQRALQLLTALSIS